MVYTSALTAAVAALLLATPACAESMYMKSSPVLQVDAKSYDRLVAKSNHTTIVEFYAPWCGHCKNLKPAYEKAAESLKGIAKVAAVNCDDDSNKQFCGSMGVQGFPTLKIVKPGKKGTPIVEDYQGERSAKAIVEAVKMKLPNHVKKVTDADFDKFLSESDDTAKALLFTEKGTISPTMKSLAVDFLGNIIFGQVRSKEAETVKRLGISNFPTLVLLPAGSDQEPIVYEGEMVREGMLSFLSQVAPPNPDPATTKEEKKPKKSKESSKPAAPSGETPVAEEAQKPIVPEVPPVKAITTPEELTSTCLGERTSTCVMVIVPEADSASSTETMKHFAEIYAKHAHAQRSLLPLVEISDSHPVVANIRKDLGLSSKLEVIAVNGRRGWWKHFESEDHSLAALESWFDALRMGEGAKSELPHGIIGTEAAEEPSGVKGTGADPEYTEPAAETTEAEPEAEPTSSESVETEAQTPEPEAEVESPVPEATEEAEPEPEVTEKPVKHEEL